MNLTTTSRCWSGWSTSIVRPAVALSIVFVGACGLLSHSWLAVTPLPPPGSPEGLLPTSLLLIVELVSAGLLTALALDLRVIRSSPRDLRGAHVLTVVASMLLVGAVAVMGVVAWLPIETWAGSGS